MVLAYSIDPAKPSEELVSVQAALRAGRARMLALVAEDSASYEAVRAARRRRKEHPGDADAEAAYRAALRGAVAVPLETARLAQELSVRLESVRAQTKAALGSDLATALALYQATTEGALANVAINLSDLSAVGEPTGEVAAEIERLRPTR
jgi:formiminotetrahydrofolate cyclodeaminase